MRGSSRRSCRGARHGAARRQGRRPRGVVGGGVLCPRRTRRSGRPSPRSSRRAASRSSSSSIHGRRSSRTSSRRRSRRAAARLRFRHGPGADNIAEWAFDDRLVDLTDTVGHFSDLFDPDALAWCTLLNAEDRPESAVRAADGPLDPPHPRLEEPPRAGRFQARGHPQRVGRFLVVLVRPGATGRAPGDGAGRHLGCRPQHVGRSSRHAECSSSSSWLPTMRTT